MSKYINIEDDGILQISDNGEPIALLHPEYKDGDRKMQKYIFKTNNNSLLDILSRIIVKQDEEITCLKSYIKLHLSNIYGSCHKSAICIKEYITTNNILISLGTIVSIEEILNHNSVTIKYNNNNFKISKNEFNKYFKMIATKS